MSEISQTRPQSIPWALYLGVAALFALGKFMLGGQIKVSSLWVEIALRLATGLAFGAVIFGLFVLSRWLLDGPEVWAFDDDGYSYSRRSRLWPMARRIAYADMAGIQLTHRAGRPQPYAMTLKLRTGKSVHIGAYWDEAELSAIRDLLATRLPGSELPLPV